MENPLLLAAGVGALLLVGGLVTYLLLRQRLLEGRCLATVRLADCALDAQPAQSSDLALNVCQRLGKLAEVGKVGPRGAAALAWANVLLAIRDHRAGRPDEATLRLDKVPSLFTSERESRRWLLRYHLAVGEVSREAVVGCLEFLQDGAARPDSPPRERVHALVRTACELRPGLDAAALAERSKWNQHAQKYLPDESWPRTNQGLVLYRLGRHDQARQILAGVVTSHTSDWKARAGLARVCAALGDADRARQELATLVQQFPEEPPVLLEVAAQRAALRDLPEANELLKKLSALDPSMAGEALALQGRLALRFGQPERALAPLEKAFAQQPEDRRLALLLAEAHSQKGDHAQALQIVRRAVPNDTTEPELQFAAACAYLNAGQVREAEAWLERCSRASYRLRDVLPLQVRCLIRLGKYSVALELLQSGKVGQDDSGDLAFYHGVILYHGAAPDKAVPHFTRALNQARRRNDRVLQDRAFANLYACYQAIGTRQVREEMFALAAQTFESLRRMIKSAHADYAAATRTLAECQTRIGLLRLSKGKPDPDRDNLALQPLEQAVTLGANPMTRMIVAGLYCRLGRHAEAVPLYDELLRTAPGNETLRFARSLAATLAGDRGEAVQTLNEFADGDSRYAMRATLAMSDVEARDDQLSAAVNRLVAALERPGARDDKYFGEIGSRSILYSLRAGQPEMAEKLAATHFGDMRLPPSLLIGSLLAQEGDYAAALTQLENPAAAAAKHRKQHQELLHTVSCRLAYEHFRNRRYDDARPVIAHALQRQDDPDLRQFGRLLITAAHNLSTGDIGDAVLRLLNELIESAERPEPMLARAALVAHHRYAFQFALEGRHASSQKYWDQASQLWKKHIEGQGRFWKGYLADYNRGKDYALKSTIAEIEERIRRRLAGLYVILCQSVILGRVDGTPDEEEIPVTARESGERLNEELEALEQKPTTYALSDEDPTLDDNERLVRLFEYYWKRAWGIAGRDGAVELFKEIVDVPALVGKLDIDKNPEQVFALYRILHEHVDPKRVEYRDGCASLALRLALKAVKQDRVSDFFRYVRAAAAADPDYNGLHGNVRRLGKSVVSRIYREFNDHSAVRQLRRKAGDDALDILLLRVLAIYASFLPRWLDSLSADAEELLDADLVQITFDAVLGAAVESLTSE